VPRSTPDDIAVAQLQGRAQYCVRHEPPRDEAIRTLREITRRPDLLARAAGIIAGASDRTMGDWPRRREAVRLLLAAGADRDLSYLYAQVRKRRPGGNRR
jgi:hypothetical protein